ncbi:hypothetical protein Tco_0918522, partial [Tanacetum coccineum]
LPIPSRPVLRGVTYTPAISHLFSLDRFESEPSERPSSPDLHETAVAQWRTRVAACSEAGVGFVVEDEAYTEDDDTYIRTDIAADSEAYS